MHYVIGVTGAIGAGKSTALRWLAKRGIPVLDADRVVHGLLAHDRETVASVAARFRGVLTEDGRIDREALGAVAFKDPEALHDLESLIHPRVLEVFRTWRDSKATSIIAVEAIKLVESGMHRQCEEIWVVNCASSIRRHRLLDRGWSSSEISKRLAATPSKIAHFAAATRVIDNGGSESSTERQLERALSDARANFDLEAIT